jgi:capping protein alpha
VYATSPSKYVIQFVANKYNPLNYWYALAHLHFLYPCSNVLSRSGRWRSEYIVDIDEGKLHGRVLINVHYFEQGNVRYNLIHGACMPLTRQNKVQLSTNYSPSFDLTPAVTSSLNASSASKILALIETREAEHQSALNDTYHDMGEKTFKGLRRALPLTRQKLDWDKVSIWHIILF